MIFRRKYRYVLLMATRDIDANASANALGRELLGVMGELNYSHANPRVAAQYSSRLFAMKVNRGSEKQLILASSFIKSINGSRIGFYTLKASGAIKSLLTYSKKIEAPRLAPG